MKKRLLILLIAIVGIFTLTGCGHNLNKKYHGEKDVILQKLDIKVDKEDWINKFKKKIENIDTFYSKQIVTKFEKVKGLEAIYQNYVVEETYEFTYDRTDRNNIKYHAFSDLYRYETLANGLYYINKDLINEYVLNGVKYRNYKSKLYEKSELIKEDEFKEKWMEFHITYYTPIIELERFLKHINLDEAEFGFDKYNNFVIQAFDTVDDKKICVNRLVFQDELLIYSFEKSKNFPEGDYNNEYIFEFEYTPREIKFPNFDGYKDITGEHHH